MFVLPLKWNVVWFMYAFKSSQFSIEVHWRTFRYSTFLKWRGKPAKFCACQIILASQWICGFLWWIINITIELDSLASFEHKLMVKRVPRTLHVLIYALNSFQNKKENWLRVPSLITGQRFEGGTWIRKMYKTLNIKTMSLSVSWACNLVASLKLHRSTVKLQNWKKVNISCKK